MNLPIFCSSPESVDMKSDVVVDRAMKVYSELLTLGKDEEMNGETADLADLLGCTGIGIA